MPHIPNPEIPNTTNYIRNDPVFLSMEINGIDKFQCFQQQHCYDRKECKIKNCLDHYFGFIPAGKPCKKIRMNINQEAYYIYRNKCRMKNKRNDFCNNP